MYIMLVKIKILCCKLYFSTYGVYTDNKNRKYITQLAVCTRIRIEHKYITQLVKFLA